jgi:hypothetical protein
MYNLPPILRSAVPVISVGVSAMAISSCGLR